MIERIYADSEEKYVKTTVVYASADEAVLTYDKEGTAKVTKDELFNLFTKGILVFMTDEYFKPVAYKETAGYGAVTVVHESVDTVVALNFYSAEKGA